MDILGSSPADEGAYSAGRALGSTISVHAGFPNPAADRTGAPLSLDKLLVQHPSSTFFFRIRGHNWHRYGVFDGDLAVIDRAITPTANQLVVWWQETGDFALSPLAQASQQTVWGTVTAIVHQFVTPNAQKPNSSSS
jgi:DNA polymerase V